MNKTITTITNALHSCKAFLDSVPQEYTEYAIIALCGLTVFIIMRGLIMPKVAFNVNKNAKLRQMEDKNLDKLKRQEREENRFSTKAKKWLEAHQEQSTRRAKTARAEKQQKELAHQLYAAGIALTPGAFQFLRSILTVICVFAVLTVCVVTNTDTETMLMGMMFGVMGPMIILRYYVSARVTMRRKSMETQLPDILDLLAISIGAGMGFDQALQYVTESSDGPLIDELIVLRRELALGKSREQAFKDLGNHCASQAVTNFTSAVVQATEMGIPLHDMLVTQAETARNTHIAAVREKAAKASIKMLIPMVLFIFPCLFIVLLGPSVMNMMSAGL
jgi:tight adherence protein C